MNFRKNNRKIALQSLLFTIIGAVVIFGFFLFVFSLDISTRQLGLGFALCLTVMGILFMIGVRKFLKERIQQNEKSRDK